MTSVGDLKRKPSGRLSNKNFYRTLKKFNAKLFGDPLFKEQVLCKGS
jgi:hypothetical protein